MPADIWGRSLGQAEDQGTEVPTVVRHPQTTCPLRARSGANREHWQSFTDTSICPLTCVRTGSDMAAHVLLSSRSLVRVAVGAPGVGQTDLKIRTDQLKAGQIDEEAHTQ
jgi:hypothetical protein